MGDNEPAEAPVSDGNGKPGNGKPSSVTGRTGAIGGDGGTKALGFWVELAANTVTVLVVAVPLLVAAFVSSSITVESETVPSALPPFLYEKLTSVANAAISAKTSFAGADAIADPARELMQRLVRVKKMQRVTLTNGSSSTIRDVSLRVSDVWNSEFFSVQCTACTQAEIEHILASCKFDGVSNLVTVGPIPQVPPRAIVSVNIYGDFGDTAFLSTVSGSHQGGDVRFVRPERVEGLEAVVARLGPFGLLALGLLFIGQQILRRTRG